MFYTNLGHNEATWTNKQFLESVQGGIQWILGQKEGDATPNPELSKAHEEKAQKDAGVVK
jgi:type 1 glutamine amidotransferase